MCCVTGSPVPSQAANSIQVLRMADAFTDQGVEVTVLAPAGNAPPDPSAIRRDYDLRHNPHIVTLPMDRRTREYGFGWRAARHTQRVGADVVYGRSLPGVLYATRRGLPGILELHAPVTGRLARVHMATLGRRLRAVVSISDALRARLAADHPALSGRIHVLHDAASPNDLAPMPLPRRGDRLQVGYVGRTYPGKGAGFLPGLAVDCPWADFHVVGAEAPADPGGPSPANLHYHGSQPPAAALRFQKAFDVLLAPYADQVRPSGGRIDIAPWMSPLKLFEYMAAGRPIVCSDLPVLREILTHDETAMLCPPGHRRAWATALKRLRDPDLRETLGRRAREVVETQHSWSARAAAVIDMADTGG